MFRKVLLFVHLSLIFILRVNAQEAKSLLVKINNSRADTTKIRLLIQLGNFCLEEQNDIHSYNLDSGYRYCKLALDISMKLKNPNMQNKAMEGIARYYAYNEDFNQAVQIEKKLVKNYHSNNDLFSEAKCWQNIGDWTRDDFNYGHLCCEKAIILFKKTNHQLEAIGALKTLGFNLSYANKLDSAELVANEVLREYLAIRYKKLYEIYVLFADINSLKGHIANELFYRKKVIRSIEMTGDQEYAPSYYTDIAACYWVLQNYKECLFYANKSVKYGDMVVFTSSTYVVACLLALKRPEDALVFLKNVTSKYPPFLTSDRNSVNRAFGNIYYALKQYKKAESYYLKIVLPKMDLAGSILQKTTDVSSYIVNEATIVRFFINTNQFQKAAYFLKNIPDSLYKYVLPKNVIDIDLFRFKVDSASGNYLSAIRHYQTYKKMSDSIFHINAVGKAEESQFKYETAQKVQSIRILQGEQNIQKVQVQKAVLVRNVTLAAIIASLILAGFAYNGYLRKKLSNLLITKKNNQLQIILTDKDKLLTEKEWLVKEIHHRVKNNLHTIICLLESQALYLDNDALKAIENSQHRIYAMSLIHQKLYQSDDIKVIDMNLYLNEFIKYLQESFGSPDHIKVTVRAGAVKLGAGQAIPMGLIINEAVNNSFKYAFPEQSEGEIAIELKKIDDEIHLSVKDNGIGFKRKADQELNSLGLELIKGLALDLRGEMKLNTDKGTSIELKFKIDYMSVPADNDSLLI